MLTKDYDITKRKHRYLRVSSEDKFKGTNARFSVNIPPSGKTVDTVVGYMVKYVSCPNMFPNIPAYANVLQIQKQTGAVDYDITVPVGQYTLAEFIVALETAINAAIPDVVTITSVFGDLLNFVFVGDSYSFDLGNSTIFEKIGLSADIAAGLNITMQNPVNLIGESEIWIHSRILNQSGLIEASGSFSVVDVLPLNVEYGGVAYMTYPSEELSLINFEPYENRKTLRQIDIVLRNRAGNELVLPSNFNFTLMLRVYHEL
jgi:hypothetical protein